MNSAVFAYIYSSTKNEMARDVHLRVQKEKIIDACKKMGWDLIAVYQELMFDSKVSRLEFRRMIFDMKPKMIKRIVVLSIDSIGNIDYLRRFIEEHIGYTEYTVYSIMEDKFYDLSFKENEATQKLKEVESKVRDIPSLPEVVTRVMNLVRDPRSSAQQLSHVIASDPGLTSRVLKLVNSAYYGFPRQISSIQKAIAMVGFTTIRGLVLSSSIFRIFTPKTAKEKTFDYKKFWKHSLMTSVAAKCISKYLYKKEDDDMFSAAMLHDIGKIILDQYDHENYIKAFNESIDVFDDELLLAAEKKYCLVSHTEIGNFIAEKWNLPSLISNSLLYHHNPREMREIDPMVIIVYMANIFSNAKLENVEVIYEMFDDDLMNFIELDKENFENLIIIVNQELEEVTEVENFTDDTI